MTNKHIFPFFATFFRFSVSFIIYTIWFMLPSAVEKTFYSYSMLRHDFDLTAGLFTEET